MYCIHYAVFFAQCLRIIRLDVDVGIACVLNMVRLIQIIMMHSQYVKHTVFSLLLI